MSDETMTKPVTRGELIEILSDYPTKKDLSEALSDYATKKDLDTWGGALRTEMRGMEQRLEHRMEGFEQQMHGMMRGMEQRLIDELRRHTVASAEDLRTQVSVVDEQYRDLPARVTRLEATVFAPRKRATRRRAARGRRP